jgi:competence protein ComEA
MKKAFFAVLISLLLALPAVAAGPVNINTADAQTIADSLTGVGMAKAEAIVAHREANGPFQSAEDLLQVKGIGGKTLEANRDLIQVK